MRSDELTLALWNCVGLSFERLCYVKEEVAADVTALIELHSTHDKWIAVIAG